MSTRVSSDTANPFIGSSSSVVKYVYDGTGVKRVVDGPNYQLKDSSNATILDFLNATNSKLTLGTLNLTASNGTTAQLAYFTNGRITVTSDFECNQSLYGDVRVVAAVDKIAMDSTGMFINKDLPMAWSSTTAWYGTPDIGFVRLSANLLGITDGASGKGNVDAKSILLPGDGNDTLQLTNSTGAPSTNSGNTITDYYGANPYTYLAQPDAWFTVVIGGNQYRVPAYT